MKLLNFFISLVFVFILISCSAPGDPGIPSYIDPNLYIIHDLNVGFGKNNNSIVPVNASLPELVVNINLDPTPVDQEACVKYAFDIIYPDLVNNVDDQITRYFNQHPNEGLLFFVKDYNNIGIPGNDIILGFTIEGPNTYVNGERRLAPISFIFVQRIKDITNANWEDKEIKRTTIHELGHLWCKGFTNDLHTSWHNGENKNQCSMQYINYNSNGDPLTNGDINGENVLNLLRFCEGHIQRGLNVSWKLKQYDPNWEAPQENTEKILLASNSNLINYQDKNNLTIELSCNSTEFIRGKAQDVLVKIKNQTSDTITTGPPKNYIYNITKDSLYTGQNGRGELIIPPYSAYYFFDAPSDYVARGMDLSTLNLFPGNYTYYISLSSSDNEYFSNKINIKINPVPDSLKSAFNDLRFIPGRVKNSVEDYKSQYKKYEGTFYSKEFLYKLLTTGNYRFAARNWGEYRNYRGEAVDLTKEFILKYPDSKYAFELFRNLTSNFNDNRTIIENILNSLKKDKPNCTLLTILENQPDDFNKLIKYLLK